MDPSTKLRPLPGGKEVAPEDPDGERAREAELVERAQGGDAQAWARLYQEQHDWLLREVTFLVADVSLAEDLVQETFAHGLARLHSFEGRSRFRRWLRGIATNLARVHWRSRDRGRAALERLRVARDQLGPPPGASPEVQEVQRRQALALAAVLETLPGQLREAFVLCDLEEQTAADAAELLGISSGNVRVRATRARARIRRELEELGWTNSRSGGGS